MVALLLDGITVRYAAEPAISALTLRVEEGEAVALLGPSGSGKTTVLRAIAGFEDPVSGDVMFDNRRMNDIPTAQRDIAMVFQQNVLFPHMNVRGNVGFPLRVRRRPVDEIAQRVEAETRATGISALLARNPNQLSAGQQQVVQVARAMVRRPGLLLVDEPFARLDPASSNRLRAELRMVQSGYGVTAVYATHSYVDAMTLADRVAIIDQGRIRQVGTPTELYAHPADRFVATFVGEPIMAFLEATPDAGGVDVGGLYLRIPVPVPDRVVVGVRPEAWTRGRGGLEGRVTSAYQVDGDFYAVVETPVGELTVRSPDEPYRRDETVELRPTEFHVFDADRGDAIHHSG